LFFVNIVCSRFIKNIFTNRIKIKLYIHIMVIEIKIIKIGLTFAFDGKFRIFENRIVKQRGDIKIQQSHCDLNTNF
jgi:hypothetical protein